MEGRGDRLRPPHTQTPTPRVPDVTPCKTSSKLLQLVRQRWPGPGQPAVPKPPPQSGAVKVYGPQTWWALPSSGFVGGLGALRAGEEPSTSQGGACPSPPLLALPCQPSPLPPCLLQAGGRQRSAPGTVLFSLSPGSFSRRDEPSKWQFSLEGAMRQLPGDRLGDKSDPLINHKNAFSVISGRHSAIGASLGLAFLASNGFNFPERHRGLVWEPRGDPAPGG